MSKSIYLTNTTSTPQSEPLLGRASDMSKNNAGGYAFTLDKWSRLDRFLILGTDGGTYYVNEGTLTRENAGVVLECIKEDGLRTVNRIVEVSDGNLAPKNDPAIYALALAAKTGDDATRALAYKSMPKVCRIGTHLFQFADAINDLGGWGRGARKSVANWYLDKEDDKLAYQLVKYRQRDGWSHRDLLRLSHPVAKDEGNGRLLSYAAGKFSDSPEPLPAVIGAYELAKNASIQETVGLIKEYNLPREAINTEYVNKPEVQEALLWEMPITALVRNLGNLTKSGVLSPFSQGTVRTIDLLTDGVRIRKSRIHPMAIYLALSVYASGRSVLGSGEWTPVQSVIMALNEAFYLSMGNVIPSGKKILYALDTSGSMGGRSYGSPAIHYDTPIAKAAAMALIAAKTESQYEIIGVDTSIQNVGIDPSMRLDQAIAEAGRHGGGGTDLSLPYQYLLQKGYDVDGIVLYTDSETWAGNFHASEALALYRRAVPHDVRNAVVSMVPNAWSVGDTKDPLTLQTIGLDASLPQTLSAFFRGEF